MTEKEIRRLLDRYWEGETTLEEERRLKAFFAQEPVPEALRREARLFRALRAEQVVKMPLRERPLRVSRTAWAAAAAVALLLSAGTWWWLSRPEMPPPVALAAPKLAPAVPVPDTAVAPLRTPVQAALRRRHKQIRISPETAPKDTFDEPEKALAEIKAALALVSSKINKGKKEVGKGLQEVENLDILIKKKSNG